MNFDKLYTWAIGVVIAFTLTGRLDTLELWIWKAQARILYESRTTTWGSPRFFAAIERIPRKGMTSVVAKNKKRALVCPEPNIAGSHWKKVSYGCNID